MNPGCFETDSAPRERLEEIEHPARGDDGSGLSLAAAPELIPPHPVLRPFPVPKQPAPRSSALPLPMTPAISVLAGIVVIVAVILTYLLTRPLPVPKVSNFVQLTHDGQPKWLVGTDGSWLYLAMGIGSSAQVSISGGEPARIPMPAPNMVLLSVSPDGSELLVADRPAATEFDAPLWTLLTAVVAGWTVYSRHASRLVEPCPL